MIKKPVQTIKHAQKSSFLFRQISRLFTDAQRDDSSLQGLTLTRVKLTPDKSTCFIFFYTPDGQPSFDKKLNQLKLYKPSLRAALAKELQGRYTPNMQFKYDAISEQQERVNKLIDIIDKEK